MSVFNVVRPIVNPIVRSIVNPRGGGFAGLLNLYPGAAAAYSLRALSSGWLAGDVVEVRRSSDGTAQGFTANQITNGDLVAFCGVGDGFVSTWYDQSGNARDATQLTVASQPQIVSSGAVLLDSNGKPSIEADGIDDFLLIADSRTITAQSLFAVGDLNSAATSNVRLFSQSDTNQDSTRTNLHIPILRNKSGSQVAVFDGSFLGLSNITYTSAFLRTVIHSGSLISPFLNGSPAATSAQTLNFPMTRQAIFAGCTSANNFFEYWNGGCGELIIYDSDQSTNRAGIEANINGRYSIY